MSLEDALEVEQPPERPPASHDAPKGWEPGIAWDTQSGTGHLTTEPRAGEPEAGVWDALLADWGLDPDAVEIVDGTVSLIGWESPAKGTQDGQTVKLKRYKVTIRRRQSGVDRADVDALCKMATRRRKAIPPAPTDTEAALIVALADWQLGKGEGDGSRGTVDRITTATDRLVGRLKEMRRVGRDVDAVYLVGLGDLVEQCSGNYPNQAFTTDLNRREQMRVARRLVFGIVDAVAATGRRVVLTGVPGNHGENRQGGKAFTDPTDNDDLAVIEQVAEACATNPDRFGNVSAFLPTDYAMTLDVAGVPVAFFHGHVTSGGGTPATKIEKWWTGQVMGQRDTVRDARILITGHYHHLIASENVGRTHFQCPAMDPGSHWFTSATGANSPAGMLTVAVGARYGGRGWGDLAVL